MNITPLEILLNEFSDYLTKKEIKSKKTVHYYCTDLKLLLGTETCANYENLAKKIHAKVISIDKSDAYKINTKNRKISSVNKFFKFLEKTNKIESAPCLKYRDYEKKPPKTITDLEFKKLISIIPEKNYRDLRNRAIFSLMFKTGATSDEIVKLRYEDFIRENSKITHVTLGKSYKRRMQKVDEKTAEELRKYEELYVSSKRPVYLKSVKRPYFRNNYGKGITSRSIRRRFEEYRDKIGLNASLSSLRASYAKEQLKRGADKHELTRLMGIEKTSSIKLIELLNQIGE